MLPDGKHPPCVKMVMSLMPEKLLEMVKVNKHYGGVHALKDFDFELFEGEIHCLVGQNGCGKSTLIKIISGVTKSDEGSQIVMYGKTLGNIRAKHANDAGIKVIYQDLSLFPNLTVAENIAFSLNTEKGIKPVNWDEIYCVAKSTLEKMHVNLELGREVSTLSIADRQLVAIARALATNAKLIIMDEPTSSLTRKEVNVLFSIIRDLNQKGLTVMFVSHKLDEIIEIADRITVMRDGSKIGTFKKEDLNNAKLTEMLSGQSVAYRQDFSKAGDKVILEVDKLSNGSQYKDVSFQLKEGEILGVIGLLGSGRTEVAMSLFGMNKPDSGTIRVNGKQVNFKNNREAVGTGIAYVPEDRLLQGLVIDQNVEDNLSISIIDRICSKIGLVKTKEKRQLTENWIKKLNIKSALPEIPASAMSGGNQQKIVISKWLATEPKILILDQPTNGIDIAAKSAIYDIIRNLVKNGMSIILISDEIPEVYYNCPRAILMHHGRVVKELDCRTLSEDAFEQEVSYGQ